MNLTLVEAVGYTGRLMKTREVAQIKRVERLIESTRHELQRPEVQDVLGEFAVRTITLLDRMYAPPVIGGHVMVPAARMDTEWIPMVVSRSGRKLSYPSEVTPSQVQQAEAEKANGWRAVSAEPLTPAEVTKLDEYDYAASVKRWPNRRADLGSQSGGVAFAVTYPTSSVYDCSVEQGPSRTLEVGGKPIVTLDFGYGDRQTPSFVYATVIHELQHVDDALKQPVAVYLAADEAAWEEDDSLKSELKAYAVQAGYLRAIERGDTYVSDIERIRRLGNGRLLDNIDAFYPSQWIKDALDDADLGYIYR